MKQLGYFVVGLLLGVLAVLSISSDIDVIEKTREKTLDQIRISEEPEVGPKFSRGKEIFRTNMINLLTEGYQLFDISFSNEQILNDDFKLYKFTADVITKIENNYDWLRIDCIFMDEEILLMKRVPINFLDRVKPSSVIPDAARETIYKSMESLPTNNRSYFGLDKRVSNIGVRGITGVDVIDIKPIGANNDHSEVLVRVSIEVEEYQRSVKGDYLLFLREYSDEKWQVEEIFKLGDSQL